MCIFITYNDIKMPQKKSTTFNQRQEEIIKEYNELSYCKTFGNVKLEDFRLHSYNNRTVMEVACTTKFLDTLSAQKQGYRFKVGVNLPIDKIREKVNNNDQELKDLIDKKIKLHNFKFNRNCDLSKDYDMEMRNLIDEFNQITKCRAINEFKLTDLLVYPIKNYPNRTNAKINMTTWAEGPAKEISQKGYRLAFVIPFSVEETKEKIANNDEALFRMIKIKLDNISGDLSCNNEPEGDTPDRTTTHTGPEDLSFNYQLSEEVLRIKTIMLN